MVSVAASLSSFLRFQRHEWEKHGQCAGVDDADDFFRQADGGLKAASSKSETGWLFRN